MPKTILLLMAWLYLAIAVPSANGDFIIPNWQLGVLVHDATGGHESAVFFDVQNPFRDAHAVALEGGLTTAEAEYDISWLLDYGSFNIQAALQAEDTGSFHVRSLSSGSIYLEPTVDLTLGIDAAYTYDLPVNPMMATLRIRVDIVETHEILFFESHHHDTFDGQPASGTFTIQGEAVLPADNLCIILYTMELNAYGSSGALATGSGYVDFQITPEPSSLSLLVLVCLGFLRRPRRR